MCQPSIKGGWYFFTLDTKHMFWHNKQQNVSLVDITDRIWRYDQFLKYYIHTDLKLHDEISK